MRGTGCSGGALRLLRAAPEPRRLRRDRDRRPPALGPAPQGRDDRASPTAGSASCSSRQTRPPSLAGDHAAVGDRQHRRRRSIRAASSTPASRSTWAEDRVHDAEPASATGGQAWALQADPGGRRDLQGQPGPAPRGGRPAGEDPTPTSTTCRRSPTRWRRSPSSTRSTCPSSWPASGPTSRPAATARRSPRASPAPTSKWFTFTNGTHIDSLDPETFNRWYDFLELYVAGRSADPLAARSRPPRRRSTRRRWASAGSPSPTTRSSMQPDLRRGARGLREPAAGPDPVRQRRRRPSPGSRIRASSARFPRFPVPETTARAWYLGRDGALSRQAPKRRRAGLVHLDRAARPPTDFTGNTRRRAACGPRRRPTSGARTRPAPPPSYVTAPLSADTTVSAPARCTRGSSRSAPDVDLQVTITEVRPDGKETFVQSGWVRANERKLDARQEHAARAGAQPAQEPTSRRCRRTASPRSRSRSTTRATSTGPARGIRVTIARAGRRPADLGVRRGRADGPGDGRGRPLARDAVAAAAPGGRRA